jgi:hypothetical protein
VRLASRVVVGAGVVVVVVVAGEAAAWAGTITDLTTGLTQRSGKTSGLNEPPPNAACKMRRRSTVMVECPPLSALDAPTPERRKISDCTVPLKPARGHQKETPPTHLARQGFLGGPEEIAGIGLPAH